MYEVWICLSVWGNLNSPLLFDTKKEKENILIKLWFEFKLVFSLEEMEVSILKMHSYFMLAHSLYRNV